MKTLDEVRKAFEYCLIPEQGCQRCPAHIDRQKPCYIWGEALFYLNEYATTLNNEPLEFSELKQMEGKPVWVEHLKDGAVYKAGWCLVVQVDDSLPDMPCIGLADTNADYCNLEVEWMVMGQWQAFRKERK